MINESNYFYVSNGKVLRSKAELLDFLREVDEQTLHTHMNLEKNDFASWLEGVFKEDSLAKKMRKAKTGEQLIQVLEDSMKQKESKKRDRKSVIAKLVKVIKHG